VSLGFAFSSLRENKHRGVFSWVRAEDAHEVDLIAGSKRRTLEVPQAGRRDSFFMSLRNQLPSTLRHRPLAP